jgi:hypothetical protein
MREPLRDKAKQAVIILGGTMVRRLSHIIIHRASWKRAILFAALFGVFYVVINFSRIGVAGLLNVSHGANILDFEFGYTYEKAFGMLTALGAEGRAFYLSKIMPLDFPYPFSYMLFYSGTIALMIKSISSKRDLGYLLVTPILAMLCDWTENIGIITMLHNYPSLPEWSVSLASTFGMLKTVFMVVTIATIAALIIIFAFLKLSRKNKHYL